MVANWKSMLSTMPSTTSSASDCASSPRRAVTRNMREALERTYQATPDPKWVVAVGDCAADGGIFAGSYAVAGSVDAVVPVDLHIRGCPPTPLQLLQGLLALLQQGSAA
jgi:Ni,Fe-hydrogenase III small subunit